MIPWIVTGPIQSQFLGRTKASQLEQTFQNQGTDEAANPPPAAIFFAPSVLL